MNVWLNKFLDKNIKYGFWLLKKEMEEKLNEKGFEFGDEEQKAINKAKELFLCGVEHLFFTLKDKTFKLTLIDSGGGCWEIVSKQLCLTSVIILNDFSRHMKFTFEVDYANELTEREFEENEFDIFSSFEQ